MNKNLHEDFSKVVLAKLSEWKNDGSEKFSGNLIDAFWFMHLDFEHFVNNIRVTPTVKKNASVIREDIANVKSKILVHYSRQFEADFKTYQVNMLDKMNANFFTLNLEKANPIDNELVLKILELVRAVKILFKEIAALQMLKPISSLFELEQLQPSFIEDNLSPEMCARLRIILARVTELKNQLRLLTLSHDEADFNAAIKFCDEHAAELGELGKQLKEVLTNLCYFLDHSFNLELILLFLFGKFERAEAGEALKLVVKKHEKFFRSLYNELNGFYSGVDVLLEIAVNACPRAISEEYYQQLPEFSSADKSRALLFKLKKLVRLYNFYRRARNIFMPQCMYFLLRDYDKIFIETRFAELSYEPMWDDLPKYTMNLFGLKHKDLAMILGVSGYDISREKQKGTLTGNHQWFWQAVTGFSDTYILGETTIPYYGKTSDYKSQYLFPAAVRMAYAEMFLDYIEDLMAYREKITNTSSISESKLTSKNEYTLKMSEQIQIMMKRIQEMRVFLNALREQCGNPQIVENIPSELLEVSEVLRNNFLRSLEICANIFQHPLFDWNTMPNYEKIQTAKAKLDSAKSKFYEAYDIDKAKEKIEECRCNYENLKNEFGLRPKRQQELLAKLEQCLSLLK
ncbi:MAG: hypothetical protein IJ685_01205 [Selenomonadaceae bacterium]|nr:hypothetical protein [Selenomonadaceae bacterium]